MVSLRNNLPLKLQPVRLDGILRTNDTIQAGKDVEMLSCELAILFRKIVRIQSCIGDPVIGQDGSPGRGGPESEGLKLFIDMTCHFGVNIHDLSDFFFRQLAADRYQLLCLLREKGLRSADIISGDGKIHQFGR